MLEPIQVSLEQLNLATLTPMLIAIAGGLVILCIDLMKDNLHRSMYVMLTMLFLLVDLGAVLGLEINERGFFDVMLIDGIAVISQLIMLVASLVFIPLALSSKKFHEYAYSEFFALFLFMIAGFQFMVSTDNLILIFVGLETGSLSLYAMIALHNREKSFESAVKYFTMGALAAGLFAFGSMMFYLVSGSVEIAVIREVLVANGFEKLTLVLVGVVFLLASLGFKLSIVPFHTWTPDVYEGASAPMAGFMSIVPKVAGFVVALRLFEFLLASDITWIYNILYVVVIVTMTFANIWALAQSGVKRMLAYSSISHAGFVLAAILIGTNQSHTALFMYWAMFVFTNMGAFTMLWISRNKTPYTTGRYDHPFEKFSGMIKTSPMAATVMAIFMLSLAGVPPFSLFWGKLYLISSAVSANEIALALIMALNSAIAVYYYLKLIVYMFLKEPVTQDGSVYMVNASNSLKAVVGFSVIITILAIFYVGPLLELINGYVTMSGY